MDQTLQIPVKIHYVTCIHCEAILGYVDRGQLAIFAYPPRGFRLHLPQRRIAGRITSGDVRCPYCDAWRSWPGEM